MKEKDEIKEKLEEVTKKLVKAKIAKKVDPVKDKDIEVMPKKDFILVDGYRQIKLTKGVSVNIPEKFKGSLKTEEII